MFLVNAFFLAEEVLHEVDERRRVHFIAHCAQVSQVVLQLFLSDRLDSFFFLSHH